MNREIVGKIKKLRIDNGFSQSDMAYSLNITRSTYQKLESYESYAWAKYLDKLLDVLETTPQEFFSDIGCRVVKQNNIREGALEYVKTLYQDNRETYEKLLAAKDD